MPVQYLSVLFPATVNQGVAAAYTVQSSDGRSNVYVNGVLIKTISTGTTSVFSGSIPSSNLIVGDNIVEVIPTGTYATTAKKWTGVVKVTAQN